MPSYHKFECRCTHKKDGGVCIYVKNHFLCKEPPDLHLPDAAFEHCIAEIRLKDRKLLIGSLYRVPNSNQQLFLKDYKELIYKLKSSKCDIILGMDHNLDFLKSHIRENTQCFINYNLENDLFPVITHPTRITHSSATLIDNLFVESYQQNTN